MSRIIFCHFYKREAEGLDFSVYPGELGSRIYDQISKQAWNEWLNKQTMLINEQKLTMLNPIHRKKLEIAMVEFLFQRRNITVEHSTPLHTQ